MMARHTPAVSVRRSAAIANSRPSPVLVSSASKALRKKIESMKGNLAALESMLDSCDAGLITGEGFLSEASLALTIIASSAGSAKRLVKAESLHVATLDDVIVGEFVEVPSDEE